MRFRLGCIALALICVLGPAQAQTAEPALPGAWIVKDVRFGNGATALQVPTPAQKQQLLSRVGATYQISPTCGQGGPAPVPERELIPQAEFARPTSGRTKRIVSLGVTSRGQGVWQISRMCGNAFAGLFYWVPGETLIVGGHNPNEMIDFEYVLQRASAPSPAAPSLANQPAPPVNQPPPGLLPCEWAGSGGAGVTRNKHYLGDKPGVVKINYDLYVRPKEITVLYRGQVIGGTGGPRSGRGGFGFNWKPVADDYSVEVLIPGEVQSTRWTYAMACPRPSAQQLQRDEAARRSAQEEAERIQRIAQADAERRESDELKQRAIAGDHDAAIKVVERANAAADRATAIQFQIIAAETGSAAEKIAVAEHLFDGSGGFPKEPDRARRLLQPAVDAGDWAAMLGLAKAESHRNGLRADNAKVLELYQRVLQSNASTEIKEAAKYALESLNKSIDENEKQKTEDVTLAKQVRDLGWFGSIDLHPISWNKNFEQYLSYARYSFTSKGLRIDVRDDISAEQRRQLNAIGVIKDNGTTGYSIRLDWKNDLCWDTKQLMNHDSELPYQSFWNTTYPADNDHITEIDTRGCVSHGQIKVERDFFLEVRGNDCGPTPRGPRGGCLIRSGKPEEREVVIFGLGPAPAPLPQAAPRQSTSESSGYAMSQADWNGISMVCECSGYAQAAGDGGFLQRATAFFAARKLDRKYQTSCANIAAGKYSEASESGRASESWERGRSQSCQQRLQLEIRSIP